MYIKCVINNLRALQSPRNPSHTKKLSKSQRALDYFGFFPCQNILLFFSAEIAFIARSVD